MAYKEISGADRALFCSLLENEPSDFALIPPQAESGTACSFCTQYPIDTVFCIEDSRLGTRYRGGTKYCYTGNMVLFESDSVANRTYVRIEELPLRAVVRLKKTIFPSNIRPYWTAVGTRREGV